MCQKVNQCYKFKKKFNSFIMHLLNRAVIFLGTKGTTQLLTTDLTVQSGAGQILPALLNKLMKVWCVNGNPEQQQN